MVQAHEEVEAMEEQEQKPMAAPQRAGLTVATDGKRLRELRALRGLSQVGLAVRAACSPGVVTSVERWGYVPGPAVRSRIARALRVRVEEIWQRGR